MSFNPFTPNFGQIPKFIAGRSRIISEIENSWENIEGNPSRTSIFIGARGTGKTALLSYFAEECQGNGMISVNVSCVAGMQEDILQQIQMRAENLLPSEHTARIKEISAGSVFSVGGRREENWRTRLTKMLESLEEYDTGLLITIDEVTPRLEEMIQLASVYQLLVREHRRISLLMAGLPAEVSLLLNNKSVSFLRRAAQYDLGRIEDYEVEEAFKKTIVQGGRSIEENALSQAVQSIQGYPYMLQLVGYRAWEAAGDENVITHRAVQDGIRIAGKDFETRVLRATVRSLSDGDMAFVRAMLPDETESEIRKIEIRMKKSSGYVSRYRARLIAHGVIEAPSRGRVAFALPGLREFLQSQ